MQKKHGRHSFLNNKILTFKLRKSSEINIGGTFNGLFNTHREVSKSIETNVCTGINKMFSIVTLHLYSMTLQSLSSVQCSWIRV